MTKNVATTYRTRGRTGGVGLGCHMGQGLADSPFAGSSCLEGLQGSSPGLQRGPRWPSAQHWARLAGLTPLFGPGTHSPFPVALSFPKRIFRPFLLFFFLFSPQVRIKKLAIWNTPNFHWLFYMTPQVTRT